MLLSIRQIAQRFIAMYWNHAREYGVGRPNTTPGVLVQNQGAQAAVVTQIREFQANHPQLTLSRVGTAAAYRQLVTAVARTVASQPVEYLQNFGGITDRFLYTRVGGGLELHAGVAYCLRRFYPLLQQLARAGWIAHVKSNSRNDAILGGADDLEDFLFHASRQSLAALGIQLRKLDGAKCFYCQNVMHAADVDHYVPFSLYPRDLAHNFVLAHPECNRRKSNALAARRHLERWLERLQARAAELSAIGQETGILTDLGMTRGVARWAYGSAAAVNGQAWIAKNEFESVDGSYLALQWEE